LSVFFKRTKTLNAQKKFNAQTIFVCNHPSAFIDPLVAANFQQPILFFATRGDIFKWWLKPITWASHMVPIFRKAQDGAESMEKNKDSFTYLGNVLLRKKSLILFGEGLTDDVFIRSLKPIKKGPARIGFETMERCDWEKDIKVQAIGLNYSHPKYFRSDMLMSLGDIIHLKEYRAIYDENPSKAVTELTRRIQKSMQDQITYVEDKRLAPFVEQLLILSRKGMNHFHLDPEHSLESRYHFSKKLAHRINEDFSYSNEKWSQLKDNVTAYFDALVEKKINENWVVRVMRKGKKSLTASILLLILGFPIFLLGLVHNFIPYFLVKRFVENTFKRDVFWSGVKMILISTGAALINLPLLFLLPSYLNDSFILALIYYLTIPVLSGIFAYHYANVFRTVKGLSRTPIDELQNLVQKRTQITDEINKLKLFE
jgi:hypothetical protein